MLGLAILAGSISNGKIPENANLLETLSTFLFVPIASRKDDWHGTVTSSGEEAFVALLFRDAAPRRAGG